MAIEQARPVDVVPMMLASYGLSKHENEGTRLVLLGLPVKRIAYQFGISPT
jgi:DNA-binding CsgD family transcriptional regulator